MKDYKAKLSVKERKTKETLFEKKNGTWYA